MTTFELTTEGKVTYRICFYDKFKRNLFNKNLLELIRKSNVKYGTMRYVELELPIIQEDDVTVVGYDIEYEFESKEQRNKFIKFVKNNVKGYYE